MYEVQESQEVPVAFLRGLKARCLWTTAQLNGDEFGYGDAQEEAYCQGRFDFESGRAANDIPPLVADIAALASGWKAGWADAGEVEEIASCQSCQDRDIDACHLHG
ncbi:MULTISPECIES: hypothetical protein [Achromobacter]|uniref:hypothetical protein n=1 Tax=Achromobacter TaxID=222 RepID=UPI0022B86414|nr:hypothetical protein [Achromobacter xylosoxidans]MCZ8441754.1 hypothetical protein [Achromobacter xylosoxidans]